MATILISLSKIMGYPFIDAYTQLEMVSWTQGCLVTWGVESHACHVAKQRTLHSELYYHSSYKPRLKNGDKYQWSKENDTSKRKKSQLSILQAFNGMRTVFLRCLSGNPCSSLALL